MDVGFVVSVAGDKGQSETAEGEEKSVHGRVVERKHTARTGCASGVGEVGMRPADAGEADSVPRGGLLQAAVGGGELGVVDEEGAATLLVHDE